jgi:four helix bundle protein
MGLVSIGDRTYHYALMIIKLVDQLPQDASGSVIAKQLIRSGTSVGANVIEAKAASSRKDFTNFLFYALKSANECKYWLELLKDSGKARGLEIGSIIEETTEICNILGASIVKLKGNG